MIYIAVFILGAWFGIVMTCVFVTGRDERE